MNDKYAKQLKKGVLEILVLKLLAGQEKYGYQLIQELKLKSDDWFTLKEGTLYPILYRLEEDGMIESRWTLAKGKEVSKKYYSITGKGKVQLQELLRLWEGFSTKVNEILKEGGDGTEEGAG